MPPRDKSDPEVPDSGIPAEPRAPQASFVCPKCQAEGSSRLVPCEHAPPARDPALALMPVALPALAETTRCEATLLFADLFGYSALAEERDIEQVAAVMGAIKHEAARIVHAHGGIVNQFVGDEIMAIFGFPRGKEDASRRAVQAALALHAFVRSAKLRHWLEPERELCLHSGIDAGVVLVATRDVRSGLFELTGGVVNRASRLRSAAAPDEVLVSHRVHARIALYFRTEQLLPLHFKGIAESVAPYRIVSARESTPVPERAPVSVRRARRELSELQAFWARRPDRDGGVVIVRGPPGSGKSRLLETFGAQLKHEGVEVLWGRCRDDDCQPFSSLARLLPREWPPLQAAILGAEGVAKLEALADHVCTEIGRTQAPHALVIDDAQWLDASSGAVLLQVAERLCSQGHLLVCAARSEASSRERLDAFLGAVPETQTALIQLGPLSTEDASSLVADYLGLERPTGAELFEQVARMSDSTPLGLVELLELLLEREYLHPKRGSWQLERESLERLPLTATAASLIARRVARLEPATALVLRIAALTRSRIDLGILTRVTELNAEQVQAALDDACVARMLELDDAGTPRFVHDAIWETLLSGLMPEERRAWHQRIADALRAQPQAEPEHTYALAHHLAAGQLERDPLRAFETLRAAAKLASAACDDALALSFLTPAEQAAQLAGLPPSAEFMYELAETCLRVGKLELAFAHFQAALAVVPERIERAHVLGRMAWIRHFQAQTRKAHELLEQALAECGQPLPASDSLALLTAAARRALGVVRGALWTRPASREIEIRAGIYVVYVRVCMENNQPLRSVAAAVALSGVTPALPKGRTRVQAEMLLAFFDALLGAKSRATGRFERTLALAKELRDPAAEGHCHQVQHVICGWRGDLDEAQWHAARCAELGRFCELGEFCHVCLSAYSIEEYRGQSAQALRWTERAIERARHAGHAPAVFNLIEEAACSTLSLMGRGDEIVRLKGQLRFVERPLLERDGYFHLVALINRARYITARSELGQDFEALCDELEQLALNPKQVHLEVVLLYVQIAHGRLHQCLRASPEQRLPLVKKLRRAHHDVAASARIPIMHSHAKVIQAACALFDGQHSTAERLLREAEDIARPAGLVWVSYQAARVRAHLLRAQGLHAAALDQAHVAALFARQYGQHARLRSIQEEFALEDGPRAGGDERAGR